MSEPLALVPSKTDAEIAKQLRRDIEEALAPVMEITSEARRLGFSINFAIGPDYKTGRSASPISSSPRCSLET